MDVLILSEMFPDPSRAHRGNFVAEEAREVSNLCNVTVIAPIEIPVPRGKFRQRRQQVAQVPLRSTLGRATVFRPRFLDAPRFSQHLNDYLMLLSTLWCIGKHRTKVDLIHSHFAHPSGFVGARLGQLLGKPVLLTVHGSDIHQQARPDYPYPLVRHRTLVALHKVDHIVAVSRALKNRVVGLGVPTRKVTVVPTGFVEQRFRVRARQSARAHLGLSQQRPVILFVGNLVQIKGVTVLLEAAAQLLRDLRDIQLVVVGDGPLRSELKAQAAGLGLDTSVFWPGQVPPEQVADFMTACDALVLPSLDEGLGVVCLEALASGRPVVASKVGGIPETISDPECGILVEPGNPQLLAWAIREALDRDWDTDRLVGRAREYGWGRIAPHIYRRYEKLLARG